MGRLAASGGLTVLGGPWGSLGVLWGTLLGPPGLPGGCPWRCLMCSGLGWEAHVACSLACGSRSGSGTAPGGPWVAVGASLGPLRGSLAGQLGLQGVQKCSSGSSSGLHRPPGRLCKTNAWLGIVYFIRSLQKLLRTWLRTG